MMAYIHCDQKPNGVIYASLYESFRDKGKVKTRRMENLGRVIDKQNNIFCQKSITYQYVLGEDARKFRPLHSRQSQLFLKPRSSYWILAMHGSCRNISPGSHFTAVSKTHFLMKGIRFLPWPFTDC